MAEKNQLHVTFRDEDLDSLRRQMLSFARLQLDDEHLAEDAVQEALAGALKNASSFSRQSTLKTWVFSILRKKIADVLRGQYREPVREACKDCALRATTIRMSDMVRIPSPLRCSVHSFLVVTWTVTTDTRS